MRTRRRAGAGAFLALLVLGGDSARAEFFNFEASAPTFTSPPGLSRPGALTSLTVFDGGFGLTITRLDGGAFDLVSNTGSQGGKAAGFGAVSLDPFFDATAEGFLGELSTAAAEVSVAVGDYGIDADVLTLTAFDGLGGTGTILGSSSLSLPTTATNSFTAGSLSVSGAGIRSFTLNGSSSDPNFPNSVFVDNIGIVPVPEPAAVAMWLAAGVPAAWWLRRRQRQAGTVGVA